MRRASEIALIAVLVASTTACSGLTDLKHTDGNGGGGSGGGTQPSAVVVSPAAATLQPFGTQVFTA